MGASAAAATIDGTHVEGVDAPNYGKLYKQLGTANKNKDVRMNVQARLNSSIEAPISPNFQINMNPGYQFDNGMSTTTNRANLTGEKA